MKVLNNYANCFAVLYLGLLLPGFAAGALGAVAADIARDDPEKMLQQATDQLLNIAKTAQSYAEKDPKRYYKAVEGVLDQVMDTEYFARGVMATYASARQYKALNTDAERTAFRDRARRFAAALQQVWMVKYADALLDFHGDHIDLKKLSSGGNSGDRASVEQIIHDTKNGQSYQVQYSLHRGEDGGWLISNVIVEGVNLGLTYRNQFAEAVEKHHGDVDYVVNNWVELMLHHPPAGTPGDAANGP